MLGVVDEDERRGLILVYAAGMTTREVAELTGVAEGTVKSRISRAKRKIRRAFGLDGVSANAIAKPRYAGGQHG